MSAEMAPFAGARFEALGTTVHLLVRDPAVLDCARQIVEGEVRALDRACSRFRDDSELSALNRAAGEAVVVSDRLLEALELALRAARLTRGVVDPTIGAPLRSLGYDRTFADVAPDGPPLTLVYRQVPGWRSVKIDRRRSTAQVPGGVELDLGATAKALGADRAAASAAALTGSGVLVSIGGDIAVAGSPPPGGWPVRVTDVHSASPDADGQTVLLSEGGLATSGTAARRWRRGGQELHHLIDPSTGQPADTCWRTVSVAASCCADANIASTAAIIMGRGAVGWLEQMGLPARLVMVDGEVTLVGPWPAPDARASPC